MTSRLVHFLSQGHAGRAPKAVQEALRIPKQGLHQRRRVKKALPKYVKIRHNGYYTRIEVPSKTRSSDAQTASRPKESAMRVSKEEAKQFVKPKSKISTGKISRTKKVLEWCRSNFAVLVLNFGSMCIFLGFSRSDVLELRSLTMTGQLTFAAYNLAQPNVLWPSVIWSTVFASVNGAKILSILHERTAEVHMTEEQERIFIEYFMEHGVTPLQFKRVEEMAKTKIVQKGQALIRKGDDVDRIFLVVSGSTHAHILGRKLTAASTGPETRGDQLQGGDSGAWIGELTFLDWFYRRQEGSSSQQTMSVDKFGPGGSMYTILADENCRVMEWTHEAMEELMGTSTDLRAALTRAITAAVVAKVVNLSITHVDRSKQSWIAWLTDRETENGTQIQVEESNQT